MIGQIDNQLDTQRFSNQRKCTPDLFKKRSTEFERNRMVKNFEYEALFSQK